MAKTKAEKCQALVQSGYRTGRQCGLKAGFKALSGEWVCGNHKGWSSADFDSDSISDSSNALTDLRSTVELEVVDPFAPPRRPQSDLPLPTTSLKGAIEQLVDPNAHPDLLRRYAFDSRTKLRVLVAAHQKTPEELKTVFAYDPEPEVRRALFDDEYLTPRVVNWVAESHTDDQMRLLALEHQHCDASVVFDVAIRERKKNIRNAAEQRTREFGSAGTAQDFAVGRRQQFSEDVKRLAVEKSYSTSVNEAARQFNTHRTSIIKWRGAYPDIGQRAETARGAQSETSEASYQQFDAQDFSSPGRMLSTLDLLVDNEEPENLLMLHAVRSVVKERVDNIVGGFAEKVWQQVGDHDPFILGGEVAGARWQVIRGGAKKEWAEERTKKEILRLAQQAPPHANEEPLDAARRAVDAMFNKKVSTKWLRDHGIQPREFAVFKPRLDEHGDPQRNLVPNIESLAAVHEHMQETGITDALKEVVPDDPVVAAKILDTVSEKLESRENWMEFTTPDKTARIYGSDNSLVADVRTEGSWIEWQHEAVREEVWNRSRSLRRYVNSLWELTGGKASVQGMKRHGLTDQEADSLQSESEAPTRIVPQAA